MADSGALTSTEIADARRFAGYSTELATASQILSVQGNGSTLDATLRAIAIDQDATTTVRTVYLASLYLIEAGIAAASDGLDVDKAAVYTRNANELADRESLFQSWRLKLCAFLGVPPGPGIYALPGAESVTPAVFVV